MHLGKAAYMEVKGIETARGGRYLEVFEHNLSRVIERGHQEILKVIRELGKLLPKEPTQPSQARELGQRDRDNDRCMTPGG